MKHWYYNKTTKEWNLRLGPINYLCFYKCQRFKIKIKWVRKKKEWGHPANFAWAHLGWLGIEWNSYGSVVKDYPGWPREWELNTLKDIKFWIIGNNIYKDVYWVIGNRVITSIKIGEVSTQDYIRRQDKCG